MNLGINGRVSVVTGASGAIGGAIARRMAREGSKVIVGYKERRGIAEELAAELTRDGHIAYAAQVDVRDSSSVAEFMNTAISLAGPPDCLINVAGVAAFAPTSQLSEEDWNNVIDTNLKGAFLCSREVLPHMLRSGFGDIINVSSIAGTIGSFEGIAYAASKAGLDQFTKSLALELGNANIRVNGVAPGRIETPFRRQRAGQYFDFMLEQTPVGRLGTADEVANAVAFLSSRICSFITGETVTVSGGLSTVFLKHVNPDPLSRLGRHENDSGLS
ncbi:SDR family NAD(P)-dependent oxidoreductase [Streptomyces microflavus]|uniref:SDR family oxidoreductase n=1 Tax=Streptomyces microflavus TaxID=1919 RepID=A0A7H8MNP7_STRMI|nr:SDR family NAD(P)-dependent oxidoreductase [Streptomyces microflavus]QKW43910.1 SDR family oxidoreductase [Streptomyces microflavus]